MSLRRRLAVPLFAAALSASMLLGSAASAKVPLVVTQEGRLFDWKGAPRTGPVTITFAFYDSASGGEPLWEETQDVDLEDGYFSARLGAVDGLDAGTLFDGSDRYLGIAFDGDVEKMPRQEMGSALHALMTADEAEDAPQAPVEVNGIIVIDDTGAWMSEGALTGVAEATVAKGAMKW